MTTETLLDRARRLVRRIDFHACDMVVFIRPDCQVDSCPAFTERAQSLLRNSSDKSSFAVVGVYSPGVTAD